MFCGQYASKDLRIQCTGETVAEVYEKVQKELDWFNQRFPGKGYPKTFRKSSVFVYEINLYPHENPRG